MKRYPAASSSTAPSPRTASEMSRAGGPPGISSAARVVGWNWKNSRSPHRGAGPPGQGQPVGGGDGGIAGAGEEPAGTAGGEQHGVGGQLLGPAAGQVGHAGDPGRRRRCRL